MATANAAKATATLAVGATKPRRMVRNFLVPVLAALPAATHALAQVFGAGSSFYPKSR
jgi:hypothetical protein